MELSIYQVDAFTSEIFGGNPAAVVPLDEWPPDEVMQKIAIENNLSETAFFVPDGNGFHLRWFTPTTEVDLCGHATLATSWVIFNELGFKKDTIRYKSQSGDLIIKRDGDKIVMDFPLWPFKREEGYEKKLEQAFGRKPLEVYSGYDWVAIFDSKEFIETMTPDMVKIAEIKEARGFIVTAKDGEKYDFVSRAFFPAIGIDEDPVTGSAHCILAPLWETKLNKKSFFTKQISQRGGELDLLIKNYPLFISGEAKLYLKGTIYV